MDTGYFYFIKDEFFNEFAGSNLMENKVINKRPCYFAFIEKKTQLLWFIPISSQYDKYESIYQKKKAKNGVCDTIILGKLLGHKCAFLIQNMFPCDAKYIENKYIHSNSPVKVDGVLQKEIETKAKKILVLSRIGKKILFTDINKIESFLSKK
jgi:hypothetical protein